MLPNALSARSQIAIAHNPKHLQQPVKILGQIGGIISIALLLAVGG